VSLQHDSSPKTCFAIAIEAPGNITREISLFRRQVFSRTQDASALAFPDVVVLAWGRSTSGRAVPAVTSSDDLRRRMSKVFQGIPGSFTSRGTAAHGGRVFLGIEGNLELFSKTAASFLDSLGCEIPTDPPFEAGIGFFISADAELYTRARSQLGIPSPSFSFFGCAFSLVRFDVALERFRAVTWKTIACARRIKRA